VADVNATLAIEQKTKTFVNLEENKINDFVENQIASTEVLLDNKLDTSILHPSFYVRDDEKTIRVMVVKEKGML
jgi:hypothetical protein